MTTENADNPLTLDVVRPASAPALITPHNTQRRKREDTFTIPPLLTLPVTIVFEAWTAQEGKEEDNNPYK